MTRGIDDDAVIRRIRLQNQSADFAGDPASGYSWLYVTTGTAHGGLFVELDTGQVVGPFVTGSYDVGARVYNSTTGTVASTTDTFLTFDSERYDTNGIHSTLSNTGRLTCQIAGKYIIVANMDWEANSSGIRQMWLRVNGTTDIGRTIMPAATGFATRMNVTTIYQLNVGDYVEFGTYQNAGVSLGVLPVGNRSPEFMMQKIG